MLFLLFCDEWLGLSRQQTAQWWQALVDAQWSRPVALRGMILARAALGPQQGPMRRFLTEQLSPQTLIDALEDLIREGVLPAGTARRIEQAVLDRTHISGQWV
jgi:hypothetical protein